MSTQRQLFRSLSLAAFAMAATGAVSAAHGQEIFEWNGRVDREVQITMRDNQVWARNAGNNKTDREQSRVMMRIPHRDGQVVAQIIDGRGSADVVQQPSARNGYTTVVRVRDARGGTDNYRVRAYWQDVSNGDIYRNDRGNNGRGRGRDDNGRDGGYGNGNGNGNGGYGNGGVNTSRGRGQEMLHWSGNVDNEIEIQIRDGRVNYRTLSGKQPTSIRTNVGSAARQNNNAYAQLAVSQNEGRGSVSVLQQPSAGNGYTTVLKVSDPQSGYGYYDFDLYWR